VVRVSGPLVVARGLGAARMFEMVRVGQAGLLGEIIEIRGDRFSIQVYEETDGIGPGQQVLRTGAPLSVELGPGLLSSVYDGVQRPLDVLLARHGTYIRRGAAAPALDRQRRWHFRPLRQRGDEVEPGDILGVVQETSTIEHRVMVPPNLSRAVIEQIEEKECRVEDPVCTLALADGSSRELTLMQRWPVRRPRPIKERVAPSEVFVSGQRVIDMFFPLMLGGTACVPGPFGSGKTVVQHQLSKWANSDVIVFIGCGERGNEMTSVLLEFPELRDPRSGKPLMERTVLVANTSNMPVAAREASVFTGITIAEYYRDMGYHVALMADSTSRWAEAMREMSGRLEEMPGEEGYPAYLASRLAAFYERAGSVVTLGGEGEPASSLAAEAGPEPDLSAGARRRRGSLTVIGAVSPPGGDMSEPVVQGTLRVTKVFWGLDARLAEQRHFPAIDWLTSYSLYNRAFDRYAEERVHPDWGRNRTEAMALLKRESELEGLVRLVGVDALGPGSRLVMEAARMVREDFLHQNAFEETDTFTSLEKQFAILDCILAFYRKARECLEEGVPFRELAEAGVIAEIARLKMVPEGEPEAFARVKQAIEADLGALIERAAPQGRTAE